MAFNQVEHLIKMANDFYQIEHLFKMVNHLWLNETFNQDGQWYLDKMINDF